MLGVSKPPAPSLGSWARIPFRGKQVSGGKAQAGAGGTVLDRVDGLRARCVQEGYSHCLFPRQDTGQRFHRL